MGDEPKAEVKEPKLGYSTKNPERASIHPDSRTVATEVGSRQEVCNNLPAEWIGSENGWRSSIPQHVRDFAAEASPGDGLSLDK